MTKSFKNLDKMLSRKNTDAGDILTDGMFRDAIGDEHKKLIKFLKSKEIIKEMCRYVFTEEYLTKSMHYLIVRNVLFVFTSPRAQFFSFYLESDDFAEECYSFLCSNNSKNPKLCGYFYTILSQQVRVGNPKFFELYPDVGDLLFARIQNNAIQELVVLSVMKLSYAVFSEQQLILNLSTVARYGDEDNAKSSIRVLIQIFENVDNDHSLMKQFSDSNVIENIFYACIDGKSPIVQDSLARLLLDFRTNGINIQHLLDEHKERLIIRKNNMSYLTVAFIPHYNPDFHVVFDLFYENDACKYIHNWVSHRIVELDKEQIFYLVKETDFLNNLVHSYNTEKWCSHMLQVTLALARFTAELTFLQMSFWEDFLREKMLRIVEILDNDYGGTTSLDENSDECVEYEDEYSYDN